MEQHDMLGGDNHKFSNQVLTISLLNGTELECYPKAEVDEAIPSGLSLDTTGEYLSIGKAKQKQVSQEESDARKAREKLFYEHAFLFLANADLICSDSRLFLAPVDVVNGIAYTGTSGFQRPTLGVYVEWWTHYSAHAIDENGRPIWYISGSPLSGANACSSVDHKGKTYKAKLCGRFWDVWQPFMEVNERYHEAKTRCMAYSLEEVIALLQGRDNAKRLFCLHLRIEKNKYEQQISALKERLQRELDGHRSETVRVQQLLLCLHRNDCAAYLQKCLDLKATVEEAERDILNLRIELGKEAISKSSFRTQRGALQARKEQVVREYDSYKRDGLKAIFGADAWRMSYEDVERAASLYGLSKDGEWQSEVNN